MNENPFFQGIATCSFTRKVTIIKDEALKVRNNLYKKFMIKHPPF